MPYLIRLWFGITEPVGRCAYAISGFGLMVFKYGVEALMIWQFASAVFWPWHFLNPVLSIRTEMLQSAPPWVGWALFTWSLPFLWIAISMSVRRAADSVAERGHSTFQLAISKRWRKGDILLFNWPSQKVEYPLYHTPLYHTLYHTPRAG